MLASARYELRLAALPPDALIAITAGAMRDSAAANRRAEALLAHHSPPPAVATDVLADPDLAPCVLEKTLCGHAAAVCKRWSLICAPRGAFARLVETAGDASSELHTAALGELRRLSGEEASSRRVDALVALLRVGNATGDEDEKADVATTLQELARDDESRVVIAAAGGVEVLVALARDGSEMQKEEAAGTLWNLSANDDLKVAIAAAGGIEVLIALARHGTEGQNDCATGALWNLSLNEDLTVAIAAAGGIEVLVALARDGTEGQKERAAGVLWNLAFNDDNKRAVVAAGGIEVLVSLARDGIEMQKEEAAGALVNLSMNDDISVVIANSVAIAAAGGIEVLIALARDGTERQKEHAAGALSNMIEAAPDTHEGVVEAGGVAVLSTLTQEASASDLCKLAAAMSLVYLASTCPDLAADDTCLSLLLSRLDQPEENGWRRDSINALLALATSLSACAEQWHRVGGVEAMQALARETAEGGVERQAERCDEALGSLGERRVRSRRRTAAYTRERELSVVRGRVMFG